MPGRTRISGSTASALTGGAGRDQDSAAGRDIPACEGEEGDEVGSG
jgi:hypothetical protein